MGISIVEVIIIILVVITFISAPRVSIEYFKEMSLSTVKLFNWGLKMISQIAKQAGENVKTVNEEGKLPNTLVVVDNCEGYDKYNSLNWTLEKWRKCYYEANPNT